jgi:hypothetical protein
MYTIQDGFNILLRELRQCTLIRAIGKTGGDALPADGFSDIDLFLFSKQIPERNIREKMLCSIADVVTVTNYGETEHPHWGLVDSILIGGQEVYLMFFTLDAFASFVDTILRGERTEREENYFYPTGRLASIQGMHAFHDPDGYIAALKENSATYPEMLRNAILSRFLPKLNDEEDFMRAIRRKDVLFYHSTLDLALDRFLQAFFALNRVYFPSRKRSLEFIRSFHIKPENCETRLKRIVELGASVETLDESHRLWQEMCRELETLVS